MDSAPDFELGALRVAPGTRKSIDIFVGSSGSTPAGSGPGDLQLTVEVLHGRCSGPTCWISGGIHGDELNGVEIARRTSRRLDPAIIHGTVLLVPVVNRSGYSNGERTLPDGRDLNRLFPGSEDGEAGERLAARVMAEIVDRCSHGVDLHTGSDGRDNLPQVYCRLDDPETAACARAFGAPVLLAAEPRPGTLRAAAIERGCKTIVYEGGGEGRLCEDAIAIGTDGVLNWLEFLGILPRKPQKPQKPEQTQTACLVQAAELSLAGAAPGSETEAEPFIPTRSCWVRSPAEGFLRLHADLGSLVESAATLGRIEVRGPSNAGLALSSSISGRVIGRSRRRYVRRGEPVLHVAARD